MLRIVELRARRDVIARRFVAYTATQLIQPGRSNAALRRRTGRRRRVGLLIEMAFLRRLYGLDPLYGLLFTFACVLILEERDAARRRALGHRTRQPRPSLAGVTNLGFTVFPTYRLFVIGAAIVVCAVVWYVLLSAAARSRASAPRPKRRRWCARWASIPSGWFSINLRGRRRAGRAGRRAGRTQPERRADDGRQDHHQHLRDRGDRLGSARYGGSVITGFSIGLLQTLGADHLPGLQPIR